MYIEGIFKGFTKLRHVKKLISTISLFRYSRGYSNKWILRLELFFFLKWSYSPYRAHNLAVQFFIVRSVQSRVSVEGPWMRPKWHPFPIWCTTLESPWMLSRFNCVYGTLGGSGLVKATGVYSHCCELALWLIAGDGPSTSKVPFAVQWRGIVDRPLMSRSPHLISHKLL